VRKLAIVTPKSRTLGGLTLFGQMLNKIGHLSCKTTINNAKNYMLLAKESYRRYLYRFVRGWLLRWAETATL
jgi:hypothetical protein